MLPTGVLPNLSRNYHRTHAKRPAANLIEASEEARGDTEDVRVQRK
jgi:hypothetical protein